MFKSKINSAYLEGWLLKIESDIKAIRAVVDSPESISSIREDELPDFSIKIGNESYSYYIRKTNENLPDYYWLMDAPKIRLYRIMQRCKTSVTSKLLETVKGGSNIGHKTNWHCANETVKCSFDNPWQLVAMVNITLDIRSNMLEYREFSECHVGYVLRSEKQILSKPSNWDW